MAVYRGKIDLVDMREIAQVGSLFTWIKYADDIQGNGMSNNPEGKNYIGMAYNKDSSIPSNDPSDYTWTLFKGQNGVGIIDTKFYYAVSDNGMIPPINFVGLTMLGDEILTFPKESGLSFDVNNSLLTIRDATGQIINLKVSDNEIVGAGSEWTETIPEVPPGLYLWTKTVYYYSDNSTITQYSSTYHGQNGEDGLDANQFKLKLNQTEILKFIDEDDHLVISPNILTAAVVKDDIYNLNNQIQITNLNIDNFTAEIYDIKSGKWANINKVFELEVNSEEEESNRFKNIITIDENFVFNINLDLLAPFASINEDPAATLLADEECILRINYIHQETDFKGQLNTYTINEFVNIRYGMTKDMASLSLKAEGLVASMQDSKLLFNANGLTIQNGSFKIIDSQGESLLYADDQSGNLSLKGNIYAEDGYFKGHVEAKSGSFKGHIEATDGSFKGKIEATSGSFKGNIEAEGGEIGGFIIEANRLRSTKIDEKDNKSLIILDGVNGTIEAENIILGTGAKIKEYIEIGDILQEDESSSNSIRQIIKLKKPEYTGDSFIEVKHFTDDNEIEVLSLDSNGVINVGNGTNKILIDGSTGTMMSQGYMEQSNFGWKIANDNCVFNNVTVRGSIRASVLEYGEVQVVGGALLVRPGSKILSAKNSNGKTILTVEDSRVFRVGDYCRVDFQTPTEIGNRYCKIESIINKTITISEEIDIENRVESLVGQSLVSFGQNTPERVDNIGIFINGSDHESFSAPQAITVFETNYNTYATNKKLELKPRVILGKLPYISEVAQLAGTYGLYAENVYLKGALVTQSTESDPIYSGINTNYSAGEQPTSDNYNQYFKDENGNPTTGPILLWAGAEKATKMGVEKAKFLVDKNGNMVANSGYFNGTIISNSTISASVIETAVLRGSNTELDEPALTIEDAKKGISFIAKDGGVVTTVFEVTKEHITANVPTFSFNNNFKIKDTGALIIPNLYISEGTSALALNKQRISYAPVFQENDLTTMNFNAYIDFSNGLKLSVGNEDGFQITSQDVRAMKTLYINQGIQYNEIAEYRPAYSGEVLIGYDLYIEE